MFELIHDVETGELTQREFTAAEIKAAEKKQAEIDAIKASEIAAAQEKELARNAVLDRLGLTAEEAALLLG